MLFVLVCETYLEVYTQLFRLAFFRSRNEMFDRGGLSVEHQCMDKDDVQEPVLVLSLRGSNTIEMKSVRGKFEYYESTVVCNSQSTCVGVFTIKRPKCASAARASGVLMVKMLNKCNLSTLVYNLFLDRQRNIFIIIRRNMYIHR